MSTAERIAREVQDFLGLSHRPVGIHIEEGLRHTEPSASPRRFCILEREDLSGRARAFCLGDVECPGASLALGLVEPAYAGVEVGPVEGADQILFTVTPRQAMAVAVLTGGIEGRCTGSHAVCGEVIACVHETGQPHPSLLCLGMRECAVSGTRSWW
jgi:hypothetical protein